MSAHIASFVILCRPENQNAVAAAATALPGVEIQHCGINGKIVAVAEGANESAVANALQALQDAPGVIAANLVYHGIDEDDSDSEGGQ